MSPPWDAGVREKMLIFWLALPFSIILIKRMHAKPNIDDLAMFIAMTALALMAARFDLFWVVALIPIWARWIDQSKPRSLFQWYGAAYCRQVIFIF
jgi:hypothetical protein